MGVINRTPDSFFDRGATDKFGAALDAASGAIAAVTELRSAAGTTGAT